MLAQEAKTFRVMLVFVYVVPELVATRLYVQPNLTSRTEYKIEKSLPCDGYIRFTDTRDDTRGLLDVGF